VGYSLLLMPLAVPSARKDATWQNYPPVLTPQRLSKSLWFNENYVALCPYSQRYSSAVVEYILRNTVHTIQIQSNPGGTTD